MRIQPGSRGLRLLGYAIFLTIGSKTVVQAQMIGEIGPGPLPVRSSEATSQIVNPASPPVEPAQAPEAAADKPDNRPDGLMKLLGIEDGPVDIYGWIQNTYTGNTNGRPPSGTNFALYPNHTASSWMGNQYYLIFENPLESDDLNFGFRVDTLFGNDWQITHSYGLFDKAFNPGQFTGLDLPQIYANVHLPILTKGGLDIKGGRFYSIAGYESVLATNRPLLSWPYLLTYTPFTFFGVLTTLHLTDRIDIYNGAVNGPDRWINQNYRYSYLGAISIKSRDERTKLTLSLLTGGPNQLPRFPGPNPPVTPSGIPTGFAPRLVNPTYNSNTLTYADVTLVHQWSERLTQVGETFLFTESNVLGFRPPAGARRTAWFGAANWFLYDFNERLQGTWRTEIFRDDDGAATGVSDTFYAMTLGGIYKPRPWLWVRPEARYDWAQFKKPFNDGTRDSRFTVGIDLIVLF